MSSLNFEVSTYLKSRFVYVLVTDMMCCAPVVAERYNGSIRADIWVFILSVLGRSNVLLSPPDTNFINLLTQYLAELHKRVS